MPFESGISRYVHARATVDIYFPVDERGVEYVRCDKCRYYSDSSRRCKLTDEVIPFPTKYVGGACPALEVEEGENV